MSKVVNELKEQEEKDLLENPQTLLKNYKRLLRGMNTVVSVVNQQACSVCPREEVASLNKLKKHKEIVSSMIREIEKEKKLFEDYIALCSDKIDNGLDIEGEFRRQKKAFERFLKDDEILLAKLRSGERDYIRAISDIQAKFDELKDTEE